ncbi:MAG: ribonuclease H-like domain-containing protein [Candidatus Magasanikbacteria bacterium]|nr:ribonuclease H-like domain-containing protein [Candidatus Magasanikbacteria bacterium]
MSLIFDIETIGEGFDGLDETTQSVLTRWIKKEAKDEGEYAVALKDLKEGLGFSPLTGEIVAIGVLDSETKTGAVYFQAPGEQHGFEEDGIKYRSMGEKEMLEKFWELANKYQEFVSFNGRGFDVPYLFIRSAVHLIRPTRDLMSNRYLSSQRFNAKHIDLLDQLSFYGASQRKGNLHLYCRAFGIESPKAGGVQGDDVARLFKEKCYVDIARYNRRDLFATLGVYDHWKRFLEF